MDGWGECRKKDNCKRVVCLAARNCVCWPVQCSGAQIVLGNSIGRVSEPLKCPTQQLLVLVWNRSTGNFSHIFIFSNLDLINQEISHYSYLGSLLWIAWPVKPHKLTVLPFRVRFSQLAFSWGEGKRKLNPYITRSRFDTSPEGLFCVPIPCGIFTTCFPFHLRFKAGEGEPLHSLWKFQKLEAVDETRFLLPLSLSGFYFFIGFVMS